MTKRLRLLAALLGSLPVALLALPACSPARAGGKEGEHHDHDHESEHRRLVFTSPLVKEVSVTQQYVCQIRARTHTEIKALQDGYLDAIPVKEGQAVKQGEVLFQVIPTLYKARFDAEQAEANLAQIEFNNTKKLFADKVVSAQEVALSQAKLDKANAKAKSAQAELDFCVVKAPFDGILDRLSQQKGSLVKKEDVLTTLSDNSVVWVYFNVPEVRYLEYMTGGGVRKGSQIELADSHIDLVLANGSKFPHSAGNALTVEGEFNRETGNIAFRADFPNPDGLLRHGQTGSVKVRKTLHAALVIPQRATFEILDKRYVWVVADGVVRQREIAVSHELDDVFVIQSGLTPADRIVFEGVRQVKDGEKAEGEFRKPEEILADQKKYAE